jgi:hypothetical protein
MKYTIKGGVKAARKYTGLTKKGLKKINSINNIKNVLSSDNLPKIMRYIVKTRTVTYAKRLSNPKPHKPPNNYESNNSNISGISNNNNVEEILFNGVKLNKKNEFNEMLKKQIDKCLKNAKIKDAPRGSYTYVLGKKGDKYEIWICRPYSKQELTTLHVNIVEMMEIHKDLVIIAGEMQIIYRRNLDKFTQKTGINIIKPNSNGNEMDKLYLFNFESGTYSAAKLNKLQEPEKQTTIDKFIGIVKTTLFQYDIPENNIIYTNSAILNKKRIITARKRSTQLKAIMRIKSPKVAAP